MGIACGQTDSPQTPPVLLQMIRDDSIHDELQLSSAQRDRVIAALASVDGRWFRARNLPAAEQREEINTLTDQLSNQLQEILDAQQRSRLGQLERQALGTRMVLRDDVADTLNLSARQRETLEKSFRETDRSRHRNPTAGAIGRARHRRGKRQDQSDQGKGTAKPGRADDNGAEIKAGIVNGSGV